MVTERFSIASDSVFVFSRYDQDRNNFTIIKQVVQKTTNIPKNLFMT